MPVTFDPSTDFDTIVDGLEAVTLYEVITGSSNSIDLALRREISYTKPDGQEITATVWHISQDSFATKIGLGSTITDAAVRVWRVIETRWQTLSERWRCVCEDFSELGAGLDKYVTLWVATFTKGTAGAAEPTWAKSSDQALSARIEIQDETPEVQNDLQMTTVRAVVTLERDIFPDAGREYQFREVQSATAWKIVKYNRGDATRLPTAEVIKVPWPYN